MILAFDVGNTNIVFGAIENGNTKFLSRVHTDINKTEDEYAVIFNTLIGIHGHKNNDFEGVIISSVVPSVLTPAF